jgi:hypothetical protein
VPELTQMRLSVWVVESVGLHKFEFSPATEQVPRTIHKPSDVVSLEFVISGSILRSKACVANWFMSDASKRETTYQHYCLNFYNNLL